MLSVRITQLQRGLYQAQELEPEGGQVPDLWCGGPSSAVCGGLGGLQEQYRAGTRLVREHFPETGRLSWPSEDAPGTCGGLCPVSGWQGSPGGLIPPPGRLGPLLTPGARMTVPRSGQEVALRRECLPEASVPRGEPSRDPQEARAVGHRSTLASVW
nr:uncharacterized protein LOC110142802 [Odocoileus virginianus texanus]